jgi:hypothetical protein
MGIHQQLPQQPMAGCAQSSVNVTRVGYLLLIVQTWEKRGLPQLFFAMTLAPKTTKRMTWDIPVYSGALTEKWWLYITIQQIIAFTISPQLFGCHEHA